MNTNFKIGDIVEDPKWGLCEITSDAGVIDHGIVVYLAKPLGERYKGWGKFCLLEKDLTLVK